MTRKLVPALGGAALAAAFYLLLIDDVQEPELFVLAAVGLLAGALLSRSREQGFTEGRVLPIPLADGARAVLRVPVEVPIVCAEAVRQLLAPRASRGEFRAVPFAEVGDGTPQSGRRAYAEALGSLAPNTIVIGVDRERGLLLVHQLRRKEAS